MTQAQTMRPATPHLTALRRRIEPTPTIEPVMVWVVLTGMPKADAMNNVIAAPVFVSALFTMTEKLENET